MKSLKVYLALFALFLVFNSNLALRKFKQPSGIVNPLPTEPAKTEEKDNEEVELLNPE